MFGGQLGTWLLTALTFLIIPRYLGPEGTGVIGIGWVFAGLGATAAGLGMTPLITREVAKDADAARNWMGTAIWLNVALGVVAAVISIAVALALGYRPLVLLSVALHVMLIPAILVSSIGAAAFQGLEVMRYAAAFNITLKLGILLAALVAIVGDMGLVGVLILTNAVPMAVAVAQVFILQRLFVFQLLSFSRQMAIALCKVSVPFFVITAVWAVYNSADILVLSLLASEADVGLVLAPARVFGTLLFIPMTIAIVTFPRFTAAARDQSAELSRMADQVLRMTLTTGIAMTLAAFTLGDDVLVRLLGGEFTDAGPLIMLLAISLVPTGVGAVLARIAFAMDRQKTVAAIGTLAMFGRVVLSLVLITVFDRQSGNPAMGAVAAFVISETVICLAMMRFIPPGTFTPESLRFYTRIGGALAASVGALALAWPAIGSLAAGVLATVVFGSAVVLFRAYTITDILGIATAMAGRRHRPAASSA